MLREPTFSDLLHELGHEDEERRRLAVQEIAQRWGNKGVVQLIGVLGDVDWRVRKTAVESLVLLGADVVAPRLIDALRAGDNAGMRNAAVEALTRFGSSALPYLLGSSTDPDPDVRKFVTDILGEIGDGAAVPRLVQLLKDEDDNVRAAAVEALGKIQDARAVLPLLEIARTAELWTRFTAVISLGKIRDPRAVPVLLGLLSDRALRKPIVDALAEIGDPNAIGPLLDLVASRDAATEQVAIGALGRLHDGLQHAFALSELDRDAVPRFAALHPAATQLANAAMAALDSLDERVRLGALLLLRVVPAAKAIPLLLELITDEEVQVPAVAALIAMGDAAFPTILEKMQGGDERERQAVALVLAGLGPRAPREVLRAGLADPNGHVRATCARALGELRDAFARETLLNLLSDPYPDVQAAAVRSLQRIGGDELLARLAALYPSSEPRLRRNLVSVMGGLGTADAAPLLVKGIRDDDGEVRRRSLLALGELEGARAVRHFALALTDEEPRVRKAAAVLLGDYGDETAVEPLLMAMEDRDVWSACSAAEGVAKLADLRALPALLKLLDSPVDVLRIAALKALHRMRPRGVRTAVLGRLKDDEPEVRRWACLALGSLPEPDATEVLAAQLESSDWRMRSAVVEALGGTRSEAALPLLHRVAADENEDTAVRVRAIGALAELGPRDDDSVTAEVLLSALGDARPEIRKAAFFSLRALANRDPGYLYATGPELHGPGLALLYALREALDDADPAARSTQGRD
ncbi:MAG: HEAT repeat domain-containing protein [Candidatus Schekmanbacteria bacterium]|nr:HEAT repeat domain-containing protein [Candidatus Schekmanbacteria bacterium]